MRLFRVVVGGFQAPLAFLTVLWLSAFWDAGETHIYGLAETPKVVFFICAAPMPALAFRMLWYNLFWQAKACLLLSTALLLLVAIGVLRGKVWGGYIGVAVFSTNALILLYDLIDNLRFGFIHVYSHHGLEVMLHWIFLPLYVSAAVCWFLSVRQHRNSAARMDS